VVEKIVIRDLSQSDGPTMTLNLDQRTISHPAHAAVPPALVRFAAKTQHVYTRVAAKIVKREWTKEQLAVIQEQKVKVTEEFKRDRRREALGKAHAEAIDGVLKAKHDGCVANHVLQDLLHSTNRLKCMFVLYTLTPFGLTLIHTYISMWGRWTTAWAASGSTVAAWEVLDRQKEIDKAAATEMEIKILREDIDKGVGVYISPQDIFWHLCDKQVWSSDRNVLK
jgi:hypothetical protein